jgi:L-iditol 2-dehydrogenase
LRVAMYYNNDDIRLDEIPKPEIDPSELLVKVIASGICGSDVMEWYRKKKAPLVLGHEIAGDIVEVGGDVRDFKEGDRVFVSHHVPCMTCGYCMAGHHTVCDMLRNTNYDPGGFAEYIRVPEINVNRGVFLLPDNMTYDEGVFIEPLGCVARGQDLAGAEPGQTVLVIGSGITGLLHIKLAKASKAERIIATDMVDYRLEAARRFGATAVIKATDDVPARVAELNDGKKADLVIICTGAPKAIDQGLNSVDRGGTILFFAPADPSRAIPIPFNELWREEVTMVGSYGASPEDLETAIDLISSGMVSVRDMITHRLGLADTGLGFRLVAEAKESIKVIIEPQK